MRELFFSLPCQIWQPLTMYRLQNTWKYDSGICEKLSLKLHLVLIILNFSPNVVAGYALLSSTVFRFYFLENPRSGIQSSTGLVMTSRLLTQFLSFSLACREMKGLPLKDCFQDTTLLYSSVTSIMYNIMFNIHKHF